MKLLVGKKILLTAGSTHEPIDSIRYFSNAAGDTLGYDIADTLLEQGAELYLISGPTSRKVELKSPRLTVITVQTAYDMYMACCKFFEVIDVAIFAASIPEYRPKEIVKEYKADSDVTIKMIKNIDIPAAFATVKRPDQRIVSFLYQTKEDYKKAILAMDKTNIDMAVLCTVYTDDTHHPEIAQTDIMVRDSPLYNVPVDLKSAFVREIINVMNNKGGDLVLSHSPNAIWQDVNFVAN